MRKRRLWDLLMSEQRIRIINRHRLLGHLVDGTTRLMGNPVSGTVVRLLALMKRLVNLGRFYRPQIRPGLWEP